MNSKELRKYEISVCAYPCFVLSLTHCPHEAQMNQAWAFRPTGILARPGNLKCVVSTNNWSFVRNWPTVKCRICSRTTAAGMYVPFLQREQRFRNRRTYLFCAALLGTVCLRVHTLGGNHQLRTRTSLHVTWCTSPSKTIGSLRKITTAQVCKRGYLSKRLFFLLHLGMCLRPRATFLSLKMLK